MDTAPRTLHASQEVTDNLGRRVVILTPMGNDGMPLFGQPIAFNGMGVAMITVQHPNGQTGQQPHPFTFAIPAISLGDAFDKWETAQSKGWEVEFQRLRAHAIRQGADLSNMPKDRGISQN